MLQVYILLSATGVLQGLPVLEGFLSGSERASLGSYGKRCEQRTGKMHTVARLGSVSGWR